MGERDARRWLFVFAVMASIAVICVFAAQSDGHPADRLATPTEVATTDDRPATPTEVATTEPSPPKAEERQPLVWERVPIPGKDYSFELPKGWEVDGPEYYIHLGEMYTISGERRGYEGKYFFFSIYRYDTAPEWTRADGSGDIRSWSDETAENLPCSGYSKILDDDIAVVGFSDSALCNSSMNLPLPDEDVLFRIAASIKRESDRGGPR